MSPAFLARLRTWLLIVMLMSVGAAVLLMSSWVILDDTYGEDWLGTAMMTAAFSFGAMLCVNILCRSRYHIVMWVGVLSCLVGFVVWQPVLWVNWWQAGMSSFRWMMAGTLATILAGWCTLFAIFASFARASTAARITMWITLAMAGVVGVMAAIAALEEPRADAFWGTLVIVSMVTACGVVTSLALGIMLRVNPVGSGESIGKHIRIELKCPRCSTMQLLHTGQSRCSTCGLRIEIAVEEPICACGYQLYKLTGNTCPECGRQIAEADRWAGAKPSQPAVVFDDGPALN